MSDEPSTISRGIGNALAFGEPGAGGGALRFAGFEFDLLRDELCKGGVPIALRPKPRSMLRYFLRHPGRLLSKDELITAIWGGVVVTDDSLVQCVAELRAALGDRDQRLIKTLPRRGYMFDTAIDEARPEPGTRPTTQAHRARRRPMLAWWLVGSLCVFLLAIAGAAWRMNADPPLHIDAEIAKRRAVAVLPVIVPDEVEGALALGNALGSDIATQISLRQWMRVMGPGAAAPYDAAKPDIARIGRELKVRYVLGSRVVRDGSGIAVDSELTSVETGEVIRLNRSTFATAGDAVRSNLAQRIASMLRVRYYEIESARASQPGHKPDAVDLTLMGWRDLNRFTTRDEVLRARGRFEAASRIDPTSVAAAQGLGSSYLIELGNSFNANPQDLLDPCERTLKRALDLGPDVPENLVPWGELLMIRGQTTAAIEVYNKALDINPSYATGHIDLARALIRHGQFEEAQRHIDKARGLSPTDTRMLYMFYAASAEAAFAQGRDSEAYGWWQKWAAEYPNSGLPYAMMAAIEALRGDNAEAAAHMVRHRELLPNDRMSSFLLLTHGDAPGYLSQRARLAEGLRKAGLPESVQ